MNALVFADGIMASAGPGGGAASLEDHGVPPLAVVAGDPLPGPHDAEPGLLVQAQAGGVLREWRVP